MSVPGGKLSSHCHNIVHYTFKQWNHDQQFLQGDLLTRTVTYLGRICIGRVVKNYAKY